MGSSSDDATMDNDTTETQEPTTTTIATVVAVPNTEDVLLGKSKLCQKQKGNLVMEELIETSLGPYKNANSAFGKTCVVAAVLQGVKAQRGRFLRYDKVLGPSLKSRSKILAFGMNP